MPLNYGRLYNPHRCHGACRASLITVEVWAEQPLDSEVCEEFDTRHLDFTC